MHSTQSQLIQDIFIAIGLIGGVALYYKSRLPRQTIADQTDYIASQELRIKELERNHIDNEKAISDLQGQIKVYKELPLRELANGINQISATNKLILSELKRAAIITPSSDKNQDVLVSVKGHE